MAADKDNVEYIPVYYHHDAEFEDFRFKKQKNSQITKLEELRYEYEILKGMRIEDRCVHSSKISQKGSECSSVISSNSSFSASRKSQTKRTKKTYNQPFYEKQHLEILIGESMKKMEKMLQNELEYKKCIHELTLKLDAHEARMGHSGELGNKEVDYLQTIDHLKFEAQRLGDLNSELGGKLEVLEGELARAKQENTMLVERLKEV